MTRKSEIRATAFVTCNSSTSHSLLSQPFALYGCNYGLPYTAVQSLTLTIQRNRKNFKDSPSCTWFLHTAIWNLHKLSIHTGLRARHCFCLSRFHPLYSFVLSVSTYFHVDFLETGQANNGNFFQNKCMAEVHEQTLEKWYFIVQQFI
jgi:hypothetical protein